MTAQLPLMLVPAGAVEIGEVACLVEDEAGGRVFVRGELVFAWNAGDELGRRLAAVQLVAIKGARAVRVAAGFGVNTETLRRWDNAMSQAGVVALVPGKRGPKGPSRLSHEVVADIRARRLGGASLRAIARAVGVSEASVRRALPAVKQPGNQEVVDGAGGDDHGDAGAGEAAAVDLPVLPPAADRSSERAAARWGQLVAAEPVFAPAARVPLAGLLLAIPALQATGLLSCATTVFGCLRNGFYGLDTVLVEGVLRALAGQPRAEGSTRIDPAALGRVLGLDRALAATDAALLQAVSPPPGETALITNTDHDGLTADLRAAESDLDTAQETHRGVPARLPLGQVNPGQQVLDVQTKLISHAIRIAAFNTATTLARAIRVHTGYARANHEAHAFVRQALTGSGDIDPREGTLTLRLDPLPTARATAAIAELCEHLTATQTRYPGTDLVLRYKVKTRP